MQQWMNLLSQHAVGQVLVNEPLAKYTTWRIGGPADVLVIPSNQEELSTLMTVLKEHQISWTQLGRGSNLLVADKGIRGVVIKLGEGFDYVTFEEDRIIVGAAHSVVKLCILAAKKGLSGLEFAGGIPGSVGGAVYMNAGAHGSDTSKILQSARIVLHDGQIVTYSVEDMQYAYRHSILQEQPGIVVEASFQMKLGDRTTIMAEMNTHKDRRRLTQPLQQPSAGSVFRNPPGDHSARLIEAAGLKGYRIGGAEISTQHANFIVNVGQSTAADVLELISHVQKEVVKQFGIELQPEVYLMGEK